MAGVKVAIRLRNSRLTCQEGCLSALVLPTVKSERSFAQLPAVDNTSCSLCCSTPLNEDEAFSIACLGVAHEHCGCQAHPFD
jgi:hypothetical protein